MCLAQNFQFNILNSLNALSKSVHWENNPKEIHIEQVSLLQVLSASQ